MPCTKSYSISKAVPLVNAWPVRPPLGGSSRSIRERPEVMAQVKALAEKIFAGMQ